MPSLKNIRFSYHSSSSSSSSSSPPLPPCEEPSPPPPPPPSPHSSCSPCQHKNHSPPPPPPPADPSPPPPPPPAAPSPPPPPPPPAAPSPPTPPPPPAAPSPPPPPPPPPPGLSPQPGNIAPPPKMPPRIAPPRPTLPPFYPAIAPSPYFALPPGSQLSIGGGGNNHMPLAIGTSLGGLFFLSFIALGLKYFLTKKAFVPGSGGHGAPPTGGSGPPIAQPSGNDAVPAGNYVHATPPSSHVDKSIDAPGQATSAPPPDNRRLRTAPSFPNDEKPEEEVDDTEDEKKKKFKGDTVIQTLNETRRLLRMLLAASNSTPADPNPSQQEFAPEKEEEEEENNEDEDAPEGNTGESKAEEDDDALNTTTPADPPKPSTKNPDVEPVADGEGQNLRTEDNPKKDEPKEHDGGDDAIKLPRQSVTAAKKKKKPLVRMLLAASNSTPADPNPSQQEFAPEKEEDEEENNEDEDAPEGNTGESKAEEDDDALNTTTPADPPKPSTKNPDVEPVADGEGQNLRTEDNPKKDEPKEHDGGDDAIKLPRQSVTAAKKKKKKPLVRMLLAASNSTPADPNPSQQEFAPEKEEDEEENNEAAGDVALAEGNTGESKAEEDDDALNTTTPADPPKPSTKNPDVEPEADGEEDEEENNEAAGDVALAEGNTGESKAEEDDDALNTTTPADPPKPSTKNPDVEPEADGEGQNLRSEDNPKKDEPKEHDGGDDAIKLPRQSVTAAKKKKKPLVGPTSQVARSNNNTSAADLVKRIDHADSNNKQSRPIRTAKRQQSPSSKLLHLNKTAHQIHHKIQQDSRMQSNEEATSDAEKDGENSFQDEEGQEDETPEDIECFPKGNKDHDEATSSRKPASSSKPSVKQITTIVKHVSNDSDKNSNERETDADGNEEEEDESWVEFGDLDMGMVLGLGARFLSDWTSKVEKLVVGNAKLLRKINERENLKRKKGATTADNSDAVNTFLQSVETQPEQNQEQSTFPGEQNPAQEALHMHGADNQEQSTFPDDDDKVNLPEGKGERERRVPKSKKEGKGQIQQYKVEGKAVTYGSDLVMGGGMCEKEQQEYDNSITGMEENIPMLVKAHDGGKTTKGSALNSAVRRQVVTDQLDDTSQLTIPQVAEHEAIAESQDVDVETGELIESQPESELVDDEIEGMEYKEHKGNIKAKRNIPSLDDRQVVKGSDEQAKGRSPTISGSLKRQVMQEFTASSILDADVETNEFEIHRNVEAESELVDESVKHMGNIKASSKGKGVPTKTTTSSILKLMAESDVLMATNDGMVEENEKDREERQWQDESGIMSSLHAESILKAKGNIKSKEGAQLGQTKAKISTLGGAIDGHKTIPAMEVLKGSDEQAKRNLPTISAALKRQVMPELPNPLGPDHEEDEPEFQNDEAATASSIPYADLETGEFDVQGLESMAEKIIPQKHEPLLKGKARHKRPMVTKTGQVKHTKGMNINEALVNDTTADEDEDAVNRPTPHLKEQTDEKLQLGPEITEIVAATEEVEEEEEV